MMDNGGFAFPHVTIPRPNLGPGIVETFTEGGMSLRDWFAGQALMGILASFPEDGTFNSQKSKNDLAADSYALADAMIAERRK